MRDMASSTAALKPGSKPFLLWLNDDDADHADLVSQLRAALDDARINAELSDHDCLRFLRARNGALDRACDMVRAWHSWRHTLGPPLKPGGLRFSPNTVLACPYYIDEHPAIHLLPVAHHGFDKHGCPIYWEKTGKVQSRFSEVLQHFEVADLVQYHVQSEEALELRYKHASRLFGRHIHRATVVFDMAHVSPMLDLQSVAYIQGILAIDQAYYPERLRHLFLINCPWYFTALYAMFKPCIDAKTADKFHILGTDFLPALAEVVDLKTIPREYGGGADVPWGGPFSEESGASHAAVIAALYEQYTPQGCRDLLTEEERESLRAALDTNDDPLLLPHKQEYLRRARDMESGGEQETARNNVSDSASADACSADNSRGPAAPVHWGRFRGLLKARITGTETVHAHGERTQNGAGSRGGARHTVYVVQVTFDPAAATTSQRQDQGQGYSWEVRRRYSKFADFLAQLRVVTNKGSGSSAGTIGGGNLEDGDVQSPDSVAALPSSPSATASNTSSSSGSGRLPALPAKTLWGSSSSPVLASRTAGLEEFLGLVLQEQLLRPLHALQDGGTLSARPVDSVQALRAANVVLQFLDPRHENVALLDDCLVGLKAPKMQGETAPPKPPSSPNPSHSALRVPTSVIHEPSGAQRSPHRLNGRNRSGSNSSTASPTPPTTVSSKSIASSAKLSSASSLMSTAAAPTMDPSPTSVPAPAPQSLLPGAAIVTARLLALAVLVLLVAQRKYPTSTLLRRGQWFADSPVILFVLTVILHETAKRCRR